MPYGEYKSFDHCVNKNKDKEDPEAYCATIKRMILGEEKKRKSYSGFMGVFKKRGES